MTHKFLFVIYMPYKKRGAKSGRRPRKVATKRTAGRRRLQPGLGAGIVGYVGYRAYKSWAGYKAALARKNSARQKANMDAATNITNIPCGLTVGKYRKPTLAEKIKNATEEPIMFRQQHAYRVDGDSGRMNWFHSNVLVGSTAAAYLAKIRESVTDVSLNPFMPVQSNTTAITAGAQEFYKMCIKYHSAQFQIMNSSTNSLKGVVMWVRPRRDAHALFIGSTTPIKPTNVFAAAINSAQPSTNVDSASNFTQGTAAGGYLVDATLGYGRAGNDGTQNNSANNVLQTDVGLKPTSSVLGSIFNYYFEVVKSTDFDLSPGQQAEFWFKMHNQFVYERQSIEYDNVKGMTYFCMIGFQGQMVGTNATTGDINAVSTGSARLSIIETHKTIIKPHVTRAPKIWNYAADPADTGILQVIADANQEIVNDETDGIDPTYGEA